MASDRIAQFKARLRHAPNSLACFFPIFLVFQLYAPLFKIPQPSPTSQLFARHLPPPVGKRIRSVLALPTAGRSTSQSFETVCVTSLVPNVPMIPSLSMVSKHPRSLVLEHTLASNASDDDLHEAWNCHDHEITISQGTHDHP